ncbi:MAG: hypothetical protein Q9174_005692 [Haloplaca sp. 1 TL-2023]
MPPPRIQRATSSQLNSFHSRTYFTCRHLSTSSSTRRPSLGPESPSFIHVPKPPQENEPYRPHIKGVLPVPRKIFPRSGKDKTSPEYISAATRDPQPRKPTSRPPLHDPQALHHIDFKSKLAADRRRNLRESLHELADRKQKIDARYLARSTAKQDKRAALLSAPTPADEQHTSPSILSTSLPSSRRGGLPDPDREARIAAKAANHARHTAFKVSERRNALHTLYMNARSFIVTEAALTEAVEKAFDPNNDQFTSDERRGLSIWNRGYPETVKEMLGAANQNGKGGDFRAVQKMSGYSNITDERMGKLGEALTGGKM